MSDLSVRILQRLDSEFHFKTVGEWLREGICPHCQKKSLYTHAVTPRVVTCGRIIKCGYSSHVRDLFDDLFKNWSEHHPQTQQLPHAAADAYLAQGRGFCIAPLKGSYTQETYTNKDLNMSSATVRFKLSNGDYWERLIDRPERFGDRKAGFNFGAKAGTIGVWWIPPNLDLTKASEIWITEGIFDAIALWQNGIAAVSSLSCNNYPAQGLADLLDQCRKAGVARPRIVWAYDNDKAGHSYTLKNHYRAKDEGWSSTAAQPPHNATTKIDWNDLHERDQLDPDHLENYRYYGQLLVAETPSAAGLLIYNRNDGQRNQFAFYHRLRLWWFNLDISKYHKEIDSLEKDEDRRGRTLPEDKIRDQALRNCSGIAEICNAHIEPLYFQRNEITDESWYYLKISTKNGEVKATFTGDQISSSAKLKPRMMSIFSGVNWKGNAHQLDHCLKYIEDLREVQTIDFIGYSAKHRAYIFQDVAFSRGQMIPVNQYDYFKIGRIEVKSLSKTPEITIEAKTPFEPKWYKDFWRVRGAKGLIALSWWMGSYFAEQIRALDSSFPFIEIVGEAGAGKSRLIEFLWKLSGRSGYEGFNPNKSSKVGVYRNFAQVANLPVVLIEGDADNDDNNKQRFDWDELKDAFNGRPIRSIGRKTANNETYEPPFRGAICIAQNSTIQASEAIITRVIHVHVDRAGQSLETKRIVDEMDRIPMEVTSTFIAHCLRNEEAILKTYSEKVRTYEAEYHAQGITHTRIALCHAQIAALVDALALHVLNGYIDLEHVLDATQLLVSMARDRVQRLNSDHPAVEQFWEVYDYLSSMGNIQLNHSVDAVNIIAINLPQFYEYAATHKQSLTDITTLKRLLPSSSRRKYIDSNKLVHSAPKSTPISPVKVRCWTFQNPRGAAQK